MTNWVVKKCSDVCLSKLEIDSQGNIVEHSKKTFVKVDDNILIKFHFQTEESDYIKTMFHCFDLYGIQWICENSQLFNIPKETSKLLMESKYIPTLKKSAENIEDCLIISQTDSQLQLYGKNGQRVETIQEGKNVSILLQPVKVEKTGEFFRLFWNIIQIKE